MFRVSPHTSSVVARLIFDLRLLLQVNELVKQLLEKEQKPHKMQMKSPMAVRRTALFNWLEQQGATVNVKFDSSRDRGHQQGLRAKRQIESGEVILEIPHAVQLTEAKAAASAVGSLVSGEKWWKERPRLGLALYVAYERTNSSSFYQPFFQTVIPVDQPMWWPYNDIVGNLNVEGQNLVLSRKLEILVDYCHLYLSLFEAQKRVGKGFPLAPLRLEDFLWSLALVFGEGEQLHMSWQGAPEAPWAIIPGHHLLEYGYGFPATVCASCPRRAISALHGAVSLVAGSRPGQKVKAEEEIFRPYPEITVEEFFLHKGMVPEEFAATTLYTTRPIKSAAATEPNGPKDFLLEIAPLPHTQLQDYWVLGHADTHEASLLVNHNGTLAVRDGIDLQDQMKITNLKLRAIALLRAEVSSSFYFCNAQRTKVLSMATRVDIRRFFLGQDACNLRMKVCTPLATVPPTILIVSKLFCLSDAGD